VVTWVQHHAALGAWWYLIFGALAFAEDAIFVGFVIPGETSMVLGGFLAYSHVLNFWVMLAVGIFAAVAGDQTGFEVGRRLGPALIRSRAGQKFGQEKWDRAQDFFARRGGPAVFLGRWVAVLRATVPAIAGMSTMRYLVFLPWNAVGGIAWASVFVTLGYVFGKSLNTLQNRLAIVNYVLIALAVVVIAGVIVWRLLRKRAQKAAGKPD
jgi:membrane-associated protein